MSNDCNSPNPPPHEWGSALIAACFAVGFLLSWGAYERRHRLADEQNAADFRHDLDTVVSEQSDLGHLLADPRTKFVRLNPVGDDLPVRLITVAWNNDRQYGAIFCDDRTAQGAERFQVLLVPTSGSPTAMAFGPTEPGRTIYLIRPAPGLSAAPPSQIVLTAWTQPPSASGETLASGNVQ